MVFHDGHIIIYKEAIKRKIPLVTSKWVVHSHLADKMMDPADYPVDDMEKYTKPLEKILNIPVSYFIYLICKTITIIYTIFLRKILLLYIYNKNHNIHCITYYFRNTQSIKNG